MAHVAPPADRAPSAAERNEQGTPESGRIWRPRLPIVRALSGHQRHGPVNRKDAFVAKWGDKSAPKEFVVKFEAAGELCSQMRAALVAEQPAELAAWRVEGLSQVESNWRATTAHPDCGSPAPAAAGELPGAGPARVQRPSAGRCPAATSPAPGDRCERPVAPTAARR